MKAKKENIPRIPKTRYETRLGKKRFLSTKSMLSCARSASVWIMALLDAKA
jgi:hypothetical protein